MSGTLNLVAGETTTISSGTTTYTSVTVGLLSTLDVTGTANVKLEGIGAGVADTFEVNGGGFLDLASFAGVSALTTFDIGSHGQMELGSGVTVSLLDPVVFDNTGGAPANLILDSGFNVSLLSAIDGWKSGDEITLSGHTISGVSWTQNSLGPLPEPGGHLTVDFAGGGSETLVFGNGSYTNANFQYSGDQIGFACFAAGTLIETAGGPVAVEDLVAGDVVRLADASQRPVKWIGFRRLRLAGQAGARSAHPIRIVAGAFAEAMPRRDLVVSPDHALVVDGTLIPARMLVNGMTIRRESNCPSVTYYHVELDAHGILLAEGLHAESYLDTGNRGMFENAAGPTDMRPDFADADPETRRALGCCLPFAVDAATVGPAWQRLAERARTLGHAPPPAGPVTTDPGLALMADGRRLLPISTDGGRYVFMLPAEVGDLRLVSRTMVPADVHPWLDDRRRLGVPVREFSVRMGRDHRTIPMDHPMIEDGWWALERGDGAMWRWTNGDAALGPFPARAMLTVRLGDLPAAYPLIEAAAAVRKVA